MTNPMTAETFDFDTSGVIQFGGNAYRPAGHFRWSDLPNDFARGYIRAAFAEWAGDLEWIIGPGAGAGGQSGVAGFSDLHPDTLASMLADCARWRVAYPKVEDTAHQGAGFWCLRTAQLVKRPDFPPLRLSLDQNGKVIAHG